MIEIETITRRVDMPSVKDRWDRLSQRCGTTAPYLRYEWYCSALETVDRDKNPLLIFFRQNNEDVGLAPFVCSREQGPLRFLHKIGFISNPFTPYQGILHTTGFKCIFTRLMQFLRHEFGNCFVLNLNEMRLESHELQAIDELSVQGDLFLCHMQEKAGSRYLLLKESFEESFGSLAKHTQRELRRKVNRISRLGKIRLSRILGREHVDRHLEKFFEIYARTWKGAEPHPEFYFRMCREFEQGGQLRFYVLTLNDKPVAYLISILSGDTIYGIKTTYDPSFSAYSPGVVLFYKVIEDLFAIAQIREFDFGRGDEQFKREWTSLIHHQVRLYLYPSSVSWKMITGLRYELLPRWKMNKRFNACYSFFRTLLPGNAKPAPALHCEDRPSPHKILKRYEYRQCERGACTVSARFATPGDLDLMTVAMAARNLSEVRERLEKELCAVCFEGKTLLSFFWLKHDTDSCNGNGTSSYTVSEWGLWSDLPPYHSKDMLISSLLMFLQGIINRSDCAVHIDQDRCRYFELF